MFVSLSVLKLKNSSEQHSPMVNRAQGLCWSPLLMSLRLLATSKYLMDTEQLLHLDITLAHMPVKLTV